MISSGFASWRFRNSARPPTIEATTSGVGAEPQGDNMRRPRTMSKWPISMPSNWPGGSDRGPRARHLKAHLAPIVPGRDAANNASRPMVRQAVRQAVRLTSAPPDTGISPGHRRRTGSPGNQDSTADRQEYTSMRRRSQGSRSRAHPATACPTGMTTINQ